MVYLSRTVCLQVWAFVKKYKCEASLNPSVHTGSVHTNYGADRSSGLQV